MICDKYRFCRQIGGKKKKKIRSVFEVVPERMSQAQLDYVNSNVSTLGGSFSEVKWMPSDNHINCILDENNRLVVKRVKQGIAVTLYVGKKYVTLPLEAFQGLCDHKLSVQYLAAFLDGHVRS